MGVDLGAAEADRRGLPNRPRQRLGFEPLSGPRGVADDLKKLTGVSPTIEKKLNDLGIFHYWQIAELRRRRTMSAKRSDCPAASKAGSPRQRNSRPSDAERPGRRCGAILIVDAQEYARQRIGNNGKYHRTDGQGPPRDDRRGHDGLQVGAQRTSGNIEAAVDLLRKKGLAKAAKKAGRVAAEGLIGIALTGTKGVVVEVNSETDFVARNDLFQGLVKMIAQVALSRDRRRGDQGGKVGSITIADAIAETVAKIGENMTLRRAAQLTVGQGVIGSYVHNSVTDGLGKIGVLVALESAGKADELKAFGRRSRCMSPPATHRRSIRPASIRRRSAREGRACRKVQGAGQACE